MAFVLLSQKVHKNYDDVVVEVVVAAAMGGGSGGGVRRFKLVTLTLVIKCCHLDLSY